MAKEIDMCSLMVAGGCSRAAGSNRVLSSSIPTAGLKLQLTSRRMAPSQPRLDVGKLKDERVAEEFANKLSGDLEGPGCFGGS